MSDATPADSPGRRATPRWALGLILGLTIPLSSAWAEGRQAWLGQLTVHEQGGACSSQPEVPHTRSLHLVGTLNRHLDGQMFLSGDTQVQSASGRRGRLLLSSVLDPTTSTGELRLRRRGNRIVGHWSEAAQPSSTECRWIRGQLTLEAVSSDHALARAASSIVAGLTALTSASVLPLHDAQRIPALQQFSDVGTSVDESGLGDLGLAQLFLDVADQARLSRAPDLALTLLMASSKLHHRLANDHPEFAAESYARLAMVLRAAREREQAESLYRQALAFLDDTRHERSGIAASLWNSLGVMYLHMHRHDDAAMAFRHALDIDRDRDVPPAALAGILNNLAHALHMNGRDDLALPLLDEAEQMLSNTVPEERDLRAVIQSSAELLRKPSADGSRLRSQPLS